MNANGLTLGVPQHENGNRYWRPGRYLDFGWLYCREMDRGRDGCSEELRTNLLALKQHSKGTMRQTLPGGARQERYKAALRCRPGRAIAAYGVPRPRLAAPPLPLLFSPSGARTEQWFATRAGRFLSGVVFAERGVCLAGDAVPMRGSC